MDNDKKKRALFELSVDTRMLYEHMRKAEQGQTVPFSEWNELIGRNVQNGARHLLLSARNLAEKDGIVFATVRGVGLRRMTDKEVAEKIIPHALHGITRKCKRTARRSACIENWDALSNDSKIKLNADRSLLGAVGAFANPGSTEAKRLVATVEKTQHALPLAKTLEIFK